MSDDGAATPYTVSFVCTGNICRSPMGEVILRDLLADTELADRVRVISAGTGDWHLGGPADPRTVATLKRFGHDGSAHIAEQFTAPSFEGIDLVLALDESHLRDLRAMAVTEEEADRIRLLRSFDEAAVAAGELDVDDPYFGDDADFVRSYEEIRAAAEGLVEHLRQVLGASPPHPGR
ncbi:MAG TPA: low molecular weight protein-tyrosine-phosphatase [Actinomycetaceae bacterium]|nr:low molecular weight protein-tyrosine-phosphatase [Actinomycetaceae bacterium]